MKSDNGLYKLIYEYFETRLLYGYYACGDSLPSIARIGDMFRMAPGTVRSALALLEKKGYIRIDARKTARVIYEAPRVSFRKNAALYFEGTELWTWRNQESFCLSLSGRKGCVGWIKKHGIGFAGRRKNLFRGLCPCLYHFI